MLYGGAERGGLYAALNAKRRQGPPGRHAGTGPHMHSRSITQPALVQAFPGSAPLALRQVGCR